MNGSLLLSPDCGYNVTFEGEEATAYLGRPWLALPTVALAATVGGDTTGGGDGGNTSSTSSSSDSGNQTTTFVRASLTPWLAGGTRQSFGREGGRFCVLGMVASNEGSLKPSRIWVVVGGREGDSNFDVVSYGRNTNFELLRRVLHLRCGGHL